MKDAALAVKNMEKERDDALNDAYAEKKRCNDAMDSVMREYSRKSADLDLLVIKKADEKVNDVIKEYNKEIQKFHNLVSDEMALIEENAIERTHELVDSYRMELDNKYRTKVIKHESLFRISVTTGFISVLIALYSSFIAVFHGIVPVAIHDVKQFFCAIFNEFSIAITTPAGIEKENAVMMIISVIGTYACIVIWTIINWNENENSKWVCFMTDEQNKVDYKSVTVIGTAVSLSLLFGHFLSDIGINTVLLPILIYTVYVMIRNEWLIIFGEHIWKFIVIIASFMAAVFSAIVYVLKCLISNKETLFAFSVLILGIVLLFIAW